MHLMYDDCCLLAQVDVQDAIGAVCIVLRSVKDEGAGMQGLQ